LKEKFLKTVQPLFKWRRRRRFSRSLWLGLACSKTAGGGGEIRRFTRLWDEILALFLTDALHAHCAPVSHDRLNDLLS
jgi:hypothetical protein